MAAPCGFVHIAIVTRRGRGFGIAAVIGYGVAIAMHWDDRGLLWVRESWQAEALNPAGFLPFLDPSALLLAQTAAQTDSLATAEEALKDGALPFVVIEITRPLDLREGRRLQLAAEAQG